MATWKALTPISRKKAETKNSRLNRNLDFRSVILEGTAMAEIYPTTFILEDDPEDVQGRLRPYGVIGLGVYHFNPQGSLSDPATVIPIG